MRADSVRNLAWFPRWPATVSSFKLTNPQAHSPAATPELTEGEYEMVQTYGIASENDSATIIVGDREDSTLLGSDSTARLAKVDGHATIVSCVSNLSNTIIGSGESIEEFFKQTCIVKG